MLNIIVIFLMVLGLFFFLGTGVGLLRFPDFYSRMHAAGKGDTLSSILLLTGYGKGELEFNRSKYHGEPDYIAEDLLDAAKWIVNDLEARGQGTA